MNRSRALAGLLLLGFAVPVSNARSLLSRDEALALAFPAEGQTTARIEAETRYLTPAQLSEARNQCGVPIESAVWTRYLGWRGDRHLGTAYFDTHLVRTLPETLLIVVTPDGAVTRVEVVSFGEPGEYLPRPAWYRQFPGRRLDPSLSTRRDIRGVTGATLSARAATEAVRRVLAIHQVLGASAATGSEVQP